jgi:[acyl-carrier-protein] S-malonyltransferase
MTKMAFIFPGQGAQYVGMGKDLAGQFARAREVFEQADDALSMKISSLCWEGPEESLTLTANAQPAILATSVACLEVLRGCGIAPAFVAGLSLGEYTALVSAGSLEFGDALRVVRQRGIAMQEACPEGTGAMAAVVGLPGEAVKRACEEAQGAGLVALANYNCPGQVVISGEKAAVLKASAIATSMGAKRVIPLAVSAPFHCGLMQPARDRMAEILSRTEVRQAQTPVIANAIAQPVSDPGDIRDCLVRQITSPVLWEQSIRLMVGSGVEVFIEVGPGKTLAGMVKKTSADVRCYSYDGRESLETFLESAQVGC